MRGPPRPAQVELEPFAGLGLALGLVEATGLSVQPSGPALIEELDGCAAALRHTWAGSSPAEIPELAPARQLYRAFGIDPTKTRPSSEALLRRVLRGQPLPRILNAVDLANLLAVRFLLPIGLYDAAQIDGPVRLRRGLPGESYAGIRKDAVHLAGRPVLADRAGPFGNPTSDSARTAVGPQTSALWMVIFAPGSYPTAKLEAEVEQSRRAIERHLGSGGAAVSTAGSLRADQ